MDHAGTPGYINTRTRVVNIGGVLLGGVHPVRIQSMTNVDTLNTKAVTTQVIDLYQAGSELVRISVPGLKHADNLANIVKQLRKAGYPVPIIADVHFNDKIAKIAARHVSKIRINPGNLYEQGIHFNAGQTENDYRRILDEIEGKFAELLKICQYYGTVIRIGTNHGSLSNRITVRYGNTTEGMVESALEYARMCENQGFRDIVLSMKASNTGIMINSNRLLTKKMEREGMNYPLHLGVTEAGNELEGRIKSASGIGTLLSEGIGDTIRVSLTEDPVRELPVAKFLASRFSKIRAEKSVMKRVPHDDCHRGNPAVPTQIPGFNEYPLIIGNPARSEHGDTIPDLEFSVERKKSILVSTSTKLRYEINNIGFLNEPKDKIGHSCILIPLNNINRKEIIKKIKEAAYREILILELHYRTPIPAIKGIIQILKDNGINNPIILKRDYGNLSIKEIILLAASELTDLIQKGVISGIWLCGKKARDEDLVRISRILLQSCGKRIYGAEYISCPSCARTLFDIEKTLAEVKRNTSHMKGLKIAVMGCIVNGPGEMADADYGYIGAGTGKINLYKHGELVRRQIDEKDAVNALVRLIDSRIQGD